MELGEGFLKDVLKRLRYYKQQGDMAFMQLQDADLFFQPNEASNSIAIIVQHMHGNMMSRFTDMLTTDGEKEWRNRDGEFENAFTTKTELLQRWNEGWQTVFNTIESLQPQDLLKTIYIRNEPLYVYDALLRQLAHYPLHVGQILYIGKLVKNTAWQSQSIPKGDSKAFNEKMQHQFKK